MSLKWNGEQVKQRAREAARVAIDRTMADCVVQAKRSHPGWQNRTGAAEGSIRIVTFAEEFGQVTRGLWGSVGIQYMIWLELKNGSALRSAADSIYPRLRRYLREEFAR